MVFVLIIYRRTLRKRDQMLSEVQIKTIPKNKKITAFLSIHLWNIATIFTESFVDLHCRILQDEHCFLIFSE